MCRAQKDSTRPSPSTPQQPRGPTCVESTYPNVKTPCLLKHAAPAFQDLQLASLQLCSAERGPSAGCLQKVSTSLPSEQANMIYNEQKMNDLHRARTCNLLIRSQAPYHWASRPSISKSLYRLLDEPRPLKTYYIVCIKIKEPHPNRSHVEGSSCRHSNSEPGPVQSYPRYEDMI